jgi:bifunctional oligoribonuclease and PAP phosphatase NrnA
VNLLGPISAAAALLVQAREVTLLAHVQPDADSLGSALALAIALHRRGTVVQVSFAEPGRMPETLRVLDTYGLVVPPERVPAAPEVVVACDAAEPARLGALADRLSTARHSIMIDHHVTNPGFGTLQLLDPSAEATVVIVRRLLAAMEIPLEADVARCIYAGLVTDTSNFITAGAAAHRLAAELVAAGVDAERLVRSLMYTHPHAWLAALGRTLERAVLEPEAAGGLGLVHTVVRRTDVDRFRIEEVDSVVDMVRTTAEAAVAAVFKQVAETRWITSLRSDGRIDVAAVAKRLGGGGHPSAAGFTWLGTEGEVLDALRAALVTEPIPPLHASPR